MVGPIIGAYNVRGPLMKTKQLANEDLNCRKDAYNGQL